MLELILVVTAWRKGWRAKALIPIAVELALDLLVMVAVGAGGGSGEGALSLVLLLSLGALITLGVMTAKAPVQFARVSVPSTSDVRSIETASGGDASGGSLHTFRTGNGAPSR